MDANNSNHSDPRLLWGKCHRVVGCGFEVLNEVGHGLKEKTYENSLVVEFGLRAIPFEQQRRFPVVHKEVVVSEYVPDLIAFGQLIVDAKVIDRITRRGRC